HHKINREACKTLIYPDNMPQRSYQYSIIKKSIFHNLLCALPTGLGKTFIASVMMLNWYRWTEDTKIVFLAPTRPLVLQQAEACYRIVGLPRKDTGVLIGGTKSVTFREELYKSVRVLFMTPHILENDIKRGIIDPKSFVCVIVDEAHHATGGHAATKAVRQILEVNPSVRIMALTATPGSTIESVQTVIDNLNISAIDMRTETNIDI
ncbi:hypothetical protein CANCADRAFT_20243, partial [Tortispora caseinolytica NRRL Y-17796]